MNKKLASLLLSSIMLPMPLSLQAQYHSQVWNPDNGNGTYTNPVLYAEDDDGCGEPYLTYHMPKSASHTKVNPQESDEFNSTELGLQWQWHANYNQLWGMPTNNGCLRLYTADLYHQASAMAKQGHSRAFGKLAISCCRRHLPRTLRRQPKYDLPQKKTTNMAVLS